MSLLRSAGAAVVAFWLIFPTSGCSRARVAPAPLPPAEVSVSRPLVRETIDYDEYTGEVSAVMTVTVSARVSGYIEKVNFIDGQNVQKDEVLFEIDPRTYQAELDVANAQIASDNAKLKFSESQVVRNLALLKRGAVTQEDVDLSVSQRDENAAQVALSKASAEDKRLYVEWCKVTSPITGRASRRNVDPGNQISGTAGMATALTTVVSQDPIYIYFDVDERAIQRYRQAAREGRNPVTDVSKISDAKLPVYASLANDTSFSHEGYIDFVDNEVNQSSGTVRCRGVFPNPEGKLVPGYFARVRVRSGKPYMGTLVTERAIMAEQSDRYVLVVGSDKVVSRRSVLPGRLQHGLRVILQGLNADEWVIVEGVQRARPGEVVVPHEVPMPEAAGSPTMGVGPLPAGSTGAPAPKLPGAENATPTAPAAAPAGNPAPAADTVPAAAPAPAASPMPPAAPTPSPTAPSGGSPAANPTN